MFVFHTVVNCVALAFFIFSRLKLVPPTANRFYNYPLNYMKIWLRNYKGVMMVDAVGVFIAMM